MIGKNESGFIFNKSEITFLMALISNRVEEGKTSMKLATTLVHLYDKLGDGLQDIKEKEEMDEEIVFD